MVFEACPGMAKEQVPQNGWKGNQFKKLLGLELVVVDA
jgi:hypothetical protein